MIDVFLSRPTWVPVAFRPGLDGFLAMLKTLELSPRTLGATDYPSRAPLDEVIDLMRVCRGAVILGLPQIVATSGSIKDISIDTPIQLPTEWNHIEAGLAYAQGLPLLVIHHTGVKRGIFDRGATPTFLYERDLSVPSWPLAEDLQGAISKWKQECVVRPNVVRSTSATPDPLRGLRRITRAERQVLRRFIDEDSKTLTFIASDSDTKHADTAHALALRGLLTRVGDRSNLWYREYIFTIAEEVFEHFADRPELLAIDEPDTSTGK